MSRRYSKGKRAVFICDRSGFKYPYTEGVVEPGTGFFVHRSESDGEYSLVSHPQNNPSKRYKFGDPAPLKHSRPETSLATDFLADEDSTFIITQDGNPISL